jgi:hypothetical protein
MDQKLEEELAYQRFGPATYMKFRHFATCRQERQLARAESWSSFCTSIVKRYLCSREMANRRKRTSQKALIEFGPH